MQLGAREDPGSYTVNACSQKCCCCCRSWALLSIMLRSLLCEDWTTLIQIILSRCLLVSSTYDFVCQDQHHATCWHDVWGIIHCHHQKQLSLALMPCTVTEEPWIHCALHVHGAPMIWTALISMLSFHVTITKKAIRRCILPGKRCNPSLLLGPIA